MSSLKLISSADSVSEIRALAVVVNFGYSSYYRFI
jgi:hypothetical protein